MAVGALLGVPSRVLVPPQGMPEGEPVLVAIEHGEGEVLPSREGVSPKDSDTNAVIEAVKAVDEGENDGVGLWLPPTAGLTLFMSPDEVGASAVAVPPNAAEEGDRAGDDDAGAD